MNRIRLLTALGAFAAGAIVAFVLPASWVFVDAPRAKKRAGHDHGTQYACPMFCVLMDERPADNRCPVCGMQMTEVSGRSTLDPQERRMIGLAVGTLARVPLSRTIRVVGEVDYDETRVERVTTRVAGFLEKVAADVTWARVEKGGELAAIYSPELYAAQKEYVVAKNSGDPSLLASARRRLALFGIGAPEIEALDASGEVARSLVLRAPRDGTVIERHAVEGTAVGKGATLYVIADLSRVWVQATVFERDLPWIRIGQDVRLDAGAAEFSGRVGFVDPVVDPRTRTARVRIEVENDERRLRIGQRVDAVVAAAMDAGGNVVAPGADAPAPLAVPRSAVLTTGKRSVLYVLFEEFMGKRDYELDPEKLPETVFYELVPVRTGPLGTGPDGAEYYPLLDPDERLREGIAVVESGNLLLDSQAQLSGKPSLLFPEGSRGGADDPHAGH